MIAEIGIVIVMAVVFLAGLGFAVFGAAVFLRRLLQRKTTEEAEGSPRYMETEKPAVRVADEAQNQPDGSAPPARGARRIFSAPSTSKDSVFSGASFVTSKGTVMDKLFVRCLIVAALTLLLLIPLAFINDMVHERSSLRRKAIADIASLWGASQTITGPALVIPYLREYTVLENVTGDDGKTRSEKRKAIAQEYRVVLPTELNFTADLKPQVRSRGIYDYVVYTSPIQVAGQFSLPLRDSFEESAIRIEWEKSWFTLGISDLRAITGVEKLQWNGKPSAPFSPGTKLKGLLGPGFHTLVDLSGLEKNDANGRTQTFSLSLTLNGSGSLHFTPVGENTRITVSGNWPHPRFEGSILPVTRKITTENFSGEWKIPHLSRTYPQTGIFGKDDFSDNSRSISSFTAGVNLFEAVSLYTQVDRAVKYGILFIGLTFVALLSFELITKARLHYLQYGLVGIAMALFYLVLLSLAEHTPFILAFCLASLISIAMNSLYIMAAFRSKNKGLLVAGLLIALYLLLYALLQMEEYALLLGTCMVVVVIAMLMFLTRHLPGSPPHAGGEKAPETAEA